MYNIYKYEALKAKEMASLNAKMVNSPLTADNPFKMPQSDKMPRELKLFDRGKQSNSLSNREQSVRQFVKRKKSMQLK